MAVPREVAEELARDAGVTPDAVAAQLQRILASPGFSGAPRLSRLLRHLVEHAAGNDREVQEYAIGVEVFDRSPSFDPRSDAIVRVQARRLRERLEGYYAGPGSADPVIIEVPKGHYRARFRQRPPAAVPSAAPSTHRPRRMVAVAGVAALAVVVAAIIWSAWRPAPAAESGQAIAVLPFRSLDDDPENQYLSDGIAAEVLNELARYPELTVIARDSSFALQDGDLNLPRLSRLLGAGYLLRGSVRRDGPALRITAQLVDGTGVQRWSGAYDRRLGDVFDIQQEIAAAVAGSVAPHLNARPGGDAPPNVDAYRHYLIGREMLAKRLPTFTRQGVAELRRAIEIDPDYAEAHAELGVALTLSVWWRTGSCCPLPEADQPDPLDQARQAIDTALRLDPALARAHAAQGLWLQMQPRPDFQGSLPALRRAKALDPHQVDTLNWLSAALMAEGRVAESIDELEHAARLDPLAPSVNVNLARHAAETGRFADAERRLRQLLELPTPQPMPHLDLAELYADTGRVAEAHRHIKEAVLEFVESRDEIGLLEVLGISYARLGLWEKAGYWLDRMEAASGNAVMAAARRSYAMQLEGRHAEMLARFESALTTTGLDVADLDHSEAAEYGLLHALAGDPETAGTTLEPLLNLPIFLNGRESPDLEHWFAWAHLRAGTPEQAARLLDRTERKLADQQRSGMLHVSEDLLTFARNAALRGDAERAAERLEAAADAGWRNYYAVVHDPRWAALIEHPRIAAVLARVKADLDEQRARVEAADRVDGFSARLEALARRSTEPDPAGLRPGR